MFSTEGFTYTYFMSTKDFNKNISTQELIDKIERVTKSRIKKKSVVSLRDYRNMTQKEERKTLLIVDDDEAIRKGLHRLLEMEGYKVITAIDGTQLSFILDDSPIDLILLDVGLPWIDGYELAQLLKEHKDLKKIPLIFISGKKDEEDVKMGFAAGADDYIKKPFDIEEIKITIKTLLTLNN